MVWREKRERGNGVIVILKVFKKQVQVKSKVNYNSVYVTVLLWVVYIFVGYFYFLCFPSLGCYVLPSEVFCDVLFLSSEYIVF